MKRLVLHISVFLFAFWFFQRGVQPKKQAEDAMKYQAFSSLPVKYEGRKKPVGTLARNLLSMLSGKQTIRNDAGEKIEAVHWLLDNISGTAHAAEYKVIRIENIDLLSSLGLEKRKHFRYSYRELLPSLTKLGNTYRTAYAKEARDRDLYDRQIIKLGNKLFTFQNVLGSFENPSTVPKEQLLAVAQRYMQLENDAVPLIIPPSSGREGWRPLMSMLLAAHPAMTSAIEGHAITPDPLAVTMGAMLAAYRAGNADTFNRHLIEYGARLQTENPEVFDRINFEVFYNRFSAFIKSAQLYLLVFLCSCLGWLFRKNGLLSAARTLMAAAFIPHTFGIVARVFLSGYPPVTNLYSSAIFIGWACVAAGIVMELGFQKRAVGIGSLAGGVSGFSTLLIAHFLSGDGDTMEQMRAVLDTRFWLATHVTTVTLGYVATFVSGTLGVFYILAGRFTRRLDEAAEDGIFRMMYGATCFAMLLSFTGTVLGGLWADDSWGRFWGWDPKENGALMIVIWNALILHAKYGRMIRHRGFAVMAVFGNVVTAWSWFGVNQLSIGLHSYGFTDSATRALTIFVITQTVLCAAGAAPSRKWKSGCM